MERLRLSRAALDRFPPAVRVPGYEVASVTPGIVHLGFGGFHRAHMARYTHDLMERQPAARNWGIVGAGLLAGDRKMHEALAPQDGLYTLVERDDRTEKVTVIGAVAQTICSADDPSSLLAAIAGRGIRIVSLTVTENGYCLHPATKRLDRRHEAIAADLEDPMRPHSAIGIIVEAYRQRMISGRTAFTALSCDNIPHNGRVLKDAVLKFAHLRDPGLAGWIAAKARFPSTMVDRITPITRPEDTAELAARYGVVDNWPVFCEPFSQWVIEDDFADGRPAWELTGAQFVSDVAPYEFMKLRLLNASHLAVAGLGRLAGYRFVHETMLDASLRRYMEALMDRETAPTLPPVPGVDLAEYKATLVARFANATIRDTLDRVNADAPVNLLVDPIRERLKADADFDLLALALAAWFRRVRGTDDAGQPVDVRHPLAPLLLEKAVEGGADPRPLLGIENLFGELGRNERLVSTVGKWLASLYRVGAAGTLRALR
ncbi:MAG TPA: mannitol dehydrogenase family protein [Rhizomicrobium sp.]|nr:mannitol dehydrogenase family protein [Rhizomicrobium sp.]